jgi:aryl-alcohol dehydrogenase-like predicted oxidoreductase
MERAWLPNARSDPTAKSDVQPRLTPDQIRAACDASLRRLQTTVIDLYQIHWPERYAPLWGTRQYRAGNEKLDVDVVANVEDTVRTIGELLSSGKIRYWGLSNETTYGVCLFAAACAKLGVPKPVSIQNDVSMRGWIIIIPAIARVMPRA